MTTWDDSFMVNLGSRGGLQVSCVKCAWFWRFHDGQALADVNTAARGHRCKAKLSVDPALDALDMVRLREDS